MAVLEVEGLSKNFGRLQVLKDVSFSVGAGEHVAVIGPNGAGKTTLLSVISGGLSATAGRICLCEKEITNMPIHRRAHIGLARSFQITNLFFDISVLDNISLALHGMKSSRYQMFRPSTSYDEVLTKARELLESVDLWEKRHELVQDVSYGEQRKMEIILSLASNPNLLLMDEPTAGLAIDEIAAFTNMIKTVVRDTAILFSLHDVDVVFDLADRVLVLYSGQIIANGTPEEVQADPRVKEIYLGTGEGMTNAEAG